MLTNRNHSQTARKVDLVQVRRHLDRQRPHPREVRR